VFANILAPLVAGLFILLYFVYFAIANSAKAASYRYFGVILVSLGVFTLGRPLQLLLGPHPLPLIIVNARMLILCGIIAPAIILASGVLDRRRRRRRDAVIVAVCALLGLTYVIFNSLGTRGSRTLFEFAGLTARDNLTPSLLPPFYGREVTIGVQVFTGIILMVFSLIALVRLKLRRPLREIAGNKVFLFNSGVLIFAVSFIIGSLLKQWGIYYTAIIASALLFGGSVLIEAREVHDYYERLVPFIKEDIIDDVAFGEISRARLARMLGCLGKAQPDSFAVIGLKGAGALVMEELEHAEAALEIASKRLAAALGEERFLVLPLTKGRIGLALRLAGLAAEADRRPILDILEEVRAEMSRALGRAVAIGLGRTYARLEDLRSSYREALAAQECAERFEGGSIVHADDISQPGQGARPYPAKEKERLLSLVKLGDTAAAAKACAEFAGLFEPFAAEQPDLLRARLYEFVGAVMDAAILGGGDEKRLSERVPRYFDEIEHFKGLQGLGDWMGRVVAETAGSVVRVREKRSKSLIQAARAYIDTNYASALSYKDVARHICISPSYFLSLFKQETGLTFVDYLTALRVERAKALLSGTDKSVTEIAYEVGFNNANYFSSTFKRVAGETAKEYRARACSGAEGSTRAP
jgi:two-component system response regulator YesN